MTLKKNKKNDDETMNESVLPGLNNKAPFK